MTGPLRNKQGCWTCRLRKKKCDESRPYCSTCQSLSITCYGYGPKPEWKDNGEKEKAVAESLRGIVKYTSRRKAASRPPEHRGQAVWIAPKTLEGVGVAVAAETVSAEDEASIQEASAIKSLTSRSNSDAGAEQITILSEHRNDLGPGSIASIPTDDSVLLVHFIDNVFPVQHPMYQKRAKSSGRGWLLALLLQSKPFYHAVMALGACYRRASSPVEADRVTAAIQQEQHLQICIQLLNQVALNECRRNGLGVLAAVPQMIFFEVCSPVPHLYFYTKTFI